jgi:hypothetical protein
MVVQDFIQFLIFSLQFIFTWFILTGLIYGFCRVLKNAVLWKPLFVALGFAMFVTVIRAVVNIVATGTMQNAYYPFDLSMGVRFDQFAALYFPPEAVNPLFALSQSAFQTINSSNAIFSGIVSVMAFVSYIWLGAMSVIVLGELKPEFSLLKRIAFSAVSLAITILLLLFLVGII